MNGFIPHIIGNDEQTAFEYLPAAAATYHIGEALYLNSSGYLAVATGTTKPQYFAYKEVVIGTNGDKLCCTRVRDDIIYETHSSAAFTDRKLGDKVTIASDGMRVTATTTSGVATVVGIDGTSSGDTIKVKFI